MEKIGIIWSAKIAEKKYFANKNVIIYDNVKMENANKYVALLENERCDIIIATAGIYYSIRDKVKVPLIVGYSDYIDIIESLRGIESFGINHQKVALVVHESHGLDAELLNRYTNNHVHLYYFQKQEEIPQLVINIKKLNYPAIVSGPTAGELASKAGLTHYPIGISNSVVMNLIKNAKKTLKDNHVQHLILKRLEQIINDLPYPMIICSEEGLIIESNNLANKLFRFTNSDKQENFIFNLLPKLEFGQNKTVDIVNINGNTFYITMKHMTSFNRDNYVLYFTKTDQLREFERKIKRSIDLGMTAQYSFDDIVHDSRLMNNLIQQAKVYSKYDYTILIQGSTGTGKEMFAQSIHNESTRRHGPFLAINCASLPESLLESELMGYEEGAFTGAVKGGKPGLFEQAHQGTVFLDEIHQMSLRLQANLLRVVQEKKIKRIGSEQLIPTDVRIIMASNEKIKEMVERGEFRKDLYYRISVLNLTIPDLEQRMDDIPRLIDLFISHYEKKYGNLEMNQKDQIQAYCASKTWPGNVRELENYVHRTCILMQNQLIDLEDSTQISKPKKTDNIDIEVGSFKHMEQQIIEKIVNRNEGNITKASLELKINRNTIAKKLKK